ncbi:OadG family protein [Dysosmobacter sp.]|uniref:OadG family protein n=1 Tax=Dysosmobacter sp. TaxID=2591382 RepID=UPI003FD768D5
MEYSSIFVCLMGMGTVFFGLICLIALTYLMSAVVGRGKKAAPAPVPAAPPCPATFWPSTSPPVRP